jgi:hypothetical protein
MVGWCGLFDKVGKEMVNKNVQVNNLKHGLYTSISLETISPKSKRDICVIFPCSGSLSLGYSGVTRLVREHISCQLDLFGRLVYSLSRDWTFKGKAKQTSDDHNQYSAAVKWKHMPTDSEVEDCN